MSSIKLKHASGNGVIISAPSSNPAADRTLELPSDSDGVIAKTDADGNITMGDFASPTDLNSAQVPTLFVDRIDNNIFGEDGALYVTQNAYFSNSGSYKRVTTARPLQYKQRLGKHKFLVGDSGSAGGNVTFSEAVIIDADGLKFNGDTAAANAISDYEEGTYTPADMSAQSINFSNVTGQYTKIGKLVHVQGSVTFPSTGGQHGFGISLPFTSTGTGTADGSGSIRYTTKSTVFTLHVNGNASSFAGYQFGGTIMRNADLSTDRLDFQVTYRTA
tara:strand:+ start:16 stop:840 length:825 start_codon:yes stop_codon:yes gene_type:complete